MNKREYLKELDIEEMPVSLEFLNQLIECHHKKISFNNVDVFFGNGEPLELGIDYLFKKVVVQKRGGYCFELNKLFYELLQSLGFDVEAKMARVNYNREGDFPRTHRVSVVELEGKNYLCDIGFGPYSPNMAVPLDSQETMAFGNRFRVRSESASFQLEIWKDSAWFGLYQFDDGIYKDSDFHLANYYTSTHKESKFVNTLVLSLIHGEEIEFLNDLVYTQQSSKGRVDTPIDRQEQFEAILRKFGILGSYSIHKIKK